MTGLFIGLTAFMISPSYSVELTEERKIQIIKTINMMNLISPSITENCVFDKIIGLDDTYTLLSAKCRLNDFEGRSDVCYGLDYRNYARKREKVLQK